ncbi:MAG TPA: EamA family transporter [Solirubrobacteraceae bacterium]|nr:EamA family transporter [Solirubrobacteraceae bacterium]
MLNAETTSVGGREPVLSRVPSPALVLGAIGSIQFGAALATTLFAQLGPGGAVTERLVTATLVLLVIWRPRVRNRSLKDLLLAGLFGVILGAMNLTFYEALHRIPLGIAVTLEMVGPLTVAVAGSRRARDLAWVALAGLGVLALTHGSSHGLNTLGIVFALCAGSLWGIYIVVNGRVGRRFTGGTGLALAMVPAALVTLPFGIAQAGTRLISGHALAVGTAVGLLSSAIPYTLEMESLRRIAAPVFGILMSLEPAVAALAGFVVLGQGLGARALAGMAVVVSASIGCSRGSRQQAVAV